MEVTLWVFKDANGGIEETLPLLSHLKLTGEIKEMAAGGRGVFISCVRNIF